MKFTVLLFLTIFFVSDSHGEASKLSCSEINKKIRRFQISIPGYQSGVKIVGNGRATIYSAPDESCKLKLKFFQPGQKMNVYSDYEGYSFVIYMNLKTDEEISGWVKSNRLEKTGYGIAPKD